jgi:1-deoxy-D-xylulose-5-phosphate synthase
MGEENTQRMRKNILHNITCPDDLKSLTVKELYTLAGEIREFLIENISKTGGHLASNLGVVELTICLHRVFTSPRDKFIFDVGHQSYVHKILTGRCDRFSTLRAKDGMSGFPKRSESEHDIINTGHSSTSISAALGICRARDLKGEDFDVIAIIGDGSLTGGMAFEALNDAASSGTNITVLLNDNGMSISRNVGALSKYLTKLRTRRTYRIVKNKYENILKHIPVIGKPIISLTEKIKTIIKYIFLDDVFFEQMGFVYMGTVDGHDIPSLLDVLENSREINKPKLIHVSTQKGRGYSFAEDKPDRYHGVAPFTILTGQSKTKTGKTYTDTAAEALKTIMKENTYSVIIAAAMLESLKLEPIRELFPCRIFDVGIAEEHAVTMAAGMALEGYIPIVAIYSTFLQRAYDQILHDVVINSLPVIFLIDRAGLVGEDGETHHGIYDMAFLSSMPNVSIMAPASDTELEKMLFYAVKTDHPVAIRYPKDLVFTHLSLQDIAEGKSEIIAEGTDVTVLAVGPMLQYAMEAAQILSLDGISTEVINVRFIKPLDKETISASAAKTKKVITIEDGVAEGGFGSRVNDLLKNMKIDIVNIGVDNEQIITQASRKQLLEMTGLNSKNIVKYAKKLHSET